LADRPCSHGHFVRVRHPRRPIGCYFCNVIDGVREGRHVDRVVGIGNLGRDIFAEPGLQRFDMF